MKLRFTLYDVQEISYYTFRAFISTFQYQLEESAFDFDSDNSDSDLSDLDMFGCGQITTEIEAMVENTVEICDPVDEVYGQTATKIIKEILNTAKEETQFAVLTFFAHITPGKDRGLIETCTEISFWCCYQTIKKYR